MPGPCEGLTPEQAEAYAAEGVVRLPGLIDLEAAEAMRSRVWHRLETRHGLWRDRPDTWRIPHPAQLTAKNDDFAAVGNAAVRGLLDQLLGVGGWKEPEHWGGLPLVTLPGHYDRWDVPHRNWHLDVAATPEPPRVARLFVVLARSEPSGGGTGYIAGSHRVLRRLAQREGQALNSGAVRKLLKAEAAWYAALESRRRTRSDRAVHGPTRRHRRRAGPRRRDAGRAGRRDPHGSADAARHDGERARHAAMMLTEWVYGL
jgi:hypothetical protein